MFGVIRKNGLDRYPFDESCQGGIASQPLTGQRAGYYKFRVGDYRVVYRLEEGDQGTRIVTAFIRRRREVYR